METKNKFSINIQNKNSITCFCFIYFWLNEKSRKSIWKTVNILPATNHGWFYWWEVGFHFLSYEYVSHLPRCSQSQKRPEQILDLPASSSFRLCCEASMEEYQKYSQENIGAHAVSYNISVVLIHLRFLTSFLICFWASLTIEINVFMQKYHYTTKHEN